MNIRIHYAIPGRQVLLVVGGVLLLTGGMIPLALLKPPALVVTAVSLSYFGLLIWGIARNLNAVGEATLDEGGLTIQPIRRALCAPAGALRVEWENLERVLAGGTMSATPKQYTILRLRRPRRSLIIMPKGEPSFDFCAAVLTRVNEARKAPLEAGDPYDSRAWRIFAMAAILLFIAAIAGTLMAGKVNDFSVWERVIPMGCFAVLLADRVFRSWRRKR